MLRKSPCLSVQMHMFITVQKGSALLVSGRSHILLAYMCTVCVLSPCSYRRGSFCNMGFAIPVYKTLMMYIPFVVKNRISIITAQYF